MTKLIYWIPRILGLGMVFFLSLFASDAFAEEAPLTAQIKDFALHLLPALAVLLILLRAWKRQRLGGLIFTVLGFGLSPYLFMLNYRINDSIWISLSVIALITLPLIVIGLLFLREAQKQKSSSN